MSEFPQPVAQLAAERLRIRVPDVQRADPGRWAGLRAAEEWARSRRDRDQRDEGTPPHSSTCPRVASRRYHASRSGAPLIGLLIAAGAVAG
jgi:hypothetical protein